MAENLPNDTNEVRDEMEHHHHNHGKKFMMCPYLAGGGVPMGMYYLYPMGGVVTGMYPFYRGENMEGMTNQMHHHHHHEALIKTIQECEVTCEHMTTMVREMHDVHMRKKQLELLRDCADICTLMAKYLARHSMFSKSLAGFCASVCEACGNECARFPDQESQNCAHICYNCARECREFSKSMV